MLATRLALACILLHAALPARAASPPARSPRKIALLHMYDAVPFFAELGALTLSNKRRYAARHAYELVAHTPAGNEGIWLPEPDSAPPCDGLHQRGSGCFRADASFAIDPRAATFGKIKLALAACVGREGYWVLWSDADALVVNQSVALEEIIDDRFDLMVSADWLMINAGVMLFKCSPWTDGFLRRVYGAREFDEARALDQSAFQHFFDTEKGSAEHIKYVPKYAINVYTEEYRPGDFLLHMAGKLYEATLQGSLAIARQFDVLSTVEDPADIDAFFSSQYLLNRFSGLCQSSAGRDSECKPDDARRLRLDEPLGYMSTPNRYRHVALRYYFIPDWKDQYDTPGWNAGRKVFDPSGMGTFGGEKGEGDSSDKDGAEEASHDEL